MNEIYFSKIAGVTYNDRQSVIRNCKKGDSLCLKREANNPYDRNAIMILHGGKQLGFVKKELAVTLAPLMDKGMEFSCTILEITGSQFNNYGVNIKIERLVREWPQKPTELRLGKEIYIPNKTVRVSVWESLGAVRGFYHVKDDTIRFYSEVHQYRGGKQLRGIVCKEKKAFRETCKIQNFFCGEQNEFEDGLENSLKLYDLLKENPKKEKNWEQLLDYFEMYLNLSDQTETSDIQKMMEKVYILSALKMQLLYQGEEEKQKILNRTDEIKDYDGIVKSEKKLVMKEWKRATNEEFVRNVLED